MNKLADNFNQIYPVFGATVFKGICSIKEPQNAGTKNFQEIRLTGFDGFLFPHELASKASSFPCTAQHKGVLTLDCDGIIFFENNGQKYILFCELKSSYVLEEIAHAKDQLIGSFVKMKSILSTIQGYKPDDYKPVGLIVSYEPTQEQLTNISKNDDKRSSFAITLNCNKFYSMPAYKCDKFFCPLAVGDFDIYYVAVPNRQTTYSIDINNVLSIGTGVQLGGVQVAH